MDYVRGGPMLCCAPVQIAIEPFYDLPWPDTDFPAYLLIADDARLFLSVSEERHRAYISPPEEFVRLTSMSGQMESGNVGAGVFSFRDMGNGPKILGFNTRRIQAIQRFTTGVNSHSQFGYSGVREDTTDLWITRDLKVDPASAAAWARTVGVGGYFSNPRLRESSEHFIRNYGCTGIPLRVVTRTSFRRSDINRELMTVDTIRADVTEIRRVPFDSARFRLPLQTRNENGVFLTGFFGDVVSKWTSYRDSPPSLFRCKHKEAPR